MIRLQTRLENPEHPQKPELRCTNNITSVQDRLLFKNTNKGRIIKASHQNSVRFSSPPKGLYGYLTTTERLVRFSQPPPKGSLFGLAPSTTEKFAGASPPPPCGSITAITTPTPEFFYSDLLTALLLQLTRLLEGHGHHGTPPSPRIRSI